MKRLLAICMMVALLSPPLFAAAQQTITPNGVARIGAENGGETPLDYAHIGVAVIDTGIDLSNPDLNVVGGIDCSSANGYSAQAETVPGAQRSVWAKAPEIARAAPEATPPAGAPVEAAQPVAAPPVVDGQREPLSFYGQRFKTQVLENPAIMGGKRAGISGYDDGNGHGTHVAGIIGAKDNGWGVVGVAPNASLYSVRVLDANGSGSLDNVICGLDWVTANADKIHVANMSLGMNAGALVMDVVEACGAPAGGPAYVPQPGKLKDEFHEAVCRATDAGVLIVAAAGNGWGDARTVVPAAYPEVIAVSNFADFDGLPGGLADADAGNCPRFGAVRDDQLFSHLNGSSTMGEGSFAGPKVELAAPGVCVVSTFPQAGFAALTGTSMASPHVAGAAARLVGNSARFQGLHDTNPAQEVAEVKAALLASAEPQRDTFHDSDEWHESIVRIAS